MCWGLIFFRIVRFIVSSGWMMTGILNNPDEKEVGCLAVVGMCSISLSMPGADKLRLFHPNLVAPLACQSVITL